MPSGALEVEPARDALTFGGASWALVGEYLRNWADLYEWAFASADLDAGGADFAGLTAAGPVSDKDVCDWIEHTAALVLESRPRRVVELGCGTGLLLRHLQDEVEAYVGVDPTKFAVDGIRAANLPGVQAVLGGAHDLLSRRVKRAMVETMGTGRKPDCVVMNGVVQCFPGTEYLATVLREAIDLVEPGGRVILGDVRNLALVAEYDQWSRAETGVEPGWFRDEDELWVDPRLIELLAEASGREVKVSIRAKTMPGDNEFTRFRYDAVIHVEPEREEPPSEAVVWDDLAERRLETVSELAGSGAVVVTGIPNALLDARPHAVTPSALSDAIGGTGFVVAVSLEDPALLEVRPSGGDRPRAASVPFEDDPLERFVARRLPELLRAYLAETFPGARLPEILVRRPSYS
ncbi:bifunctional 2-polyprenyl-6-hydroxyphenol methylase/3-demethylubiquinol 3-O-methyltransferase UbiG [Amycolatopsis sp. WAC 04197]|uniref:class I SAM-dependent methyltransferase n=1 Tax=Amycolatopsis sp. WAC 04197 TaxID=2203199 RepID=UPI000F7A3C7F|nr:methyltransferase domain-containing protein [Amycolatopsis sp. WAC 04197]